MTAEDGSSPTLQSLFDFIMTTKYEDIPENVREEGRRALLDVVGCGIGAQNMELAKIAKDFAAAMYGGKGGYIWCGNESVSVLGAALANSLTVDALDIHDSAHNAKGHAGVALVPAVLLLSGPLTRIPGFEHLSERKMAEAACSKPITGEELLTSLIVGYEVAYRAGETLIATATDYHSSGAWNAIGCAAMWARRLQLTYEETMHAFGIAEYYGPRSPVMRVMDNPTMLKDGSGVGCWAGLTGAILASKGFTGAPADLLVPRRREDIWSDLGSKWHLLIFHVYKRHPTCYWAQGAIHGALVAREQLLKEGMSHLDIESISVKTFPEACHLFQCAPANSEQAQYSINFSVASAIAHGKVDVSLEGIKDPVVLSVLARTEVTTHETFMEQKEHETSIHDNCADVMVKLSNGSIISSGMRYVEWDVYRGEKPPSNEELLQKFEGLCASVDADPVQSQKIARLCFNVDHLRDASVIHNALSTLNVNMHRNEEDFEKNFAKSIPKQEIPQEVESVVEEQKVLL